MLAELNVLRALEGLGGYDFITPTPATHARHLRHCGRRVAEDIRDILGWNLPFDPDLIPRTLADALVEADAVEPEGDGLLRSRIRVSTLGGRLFIHSAFPTEAEDSVFFGPDSYRFVRFVREHQADLSHLAHALDVGAGTGVGGIMLATAVPTLEVTLVDINPLALRYAAANAAHAGQRPRLIKGGGLSAVPTPFDAVIANPPFMMDPAARAYRDGGGMWGAQLSLDWALDAARRLPVGGRMLLYTGVAIRRGRDGLREALLQSLPRFGCTMRYEEIDVDIFGEQLEQPEYAGVERIAGIGAVIAKERMA